MSHFNQYKPYAKPDSTPYTPPGFQMFPRYLSTILMFPFEKKYVGHDSGVMLSDSSVPRNIWEMLVFCSRPYMP